MHGIEGNRSKALRNHFVAFQSLMGIQLCVLQDIVKCTNLPSNTAGTIHSVLLFNEECRRAVRKGKKRGKWFQIYQRFPSHFEEVMLSIVIFKWWSYIYLVSITHVYMALDVSICGTSDVQIFMFWLLFQIYKNGFVKLVATEPMDHLRHTWVIKKLIPNHMDSNSPSIYMCTFLIRVLL